MSIDKVVKAADIYASVRQGLGEQAPSFAGREAELAKAKIDLTKVLEEHINTLAAEVESLQQALSRTVYTLNRLKALNNKMQAHPIWSGNDLIKLLQTLTELDRKP